MGRGVVLPVQSLGPKRPYGTEYNQLTQYMLVSLRRGVDFVSTYAVIRTHTHARIADYGIQCRIDQEIQEIGNTGINKYRN